MSLEFRVALDWKPQGKRPGGRPRKIWFGVVEGNLKTLGIEDCREADQDTSGEV